MERITLHTGLDNFLMPDMISGITASRIETRKKFRKADFQFFSGIETLAQSGALHVRYITDFQKHAFLLKINSYDSLSLNPEAGIYRIFGALESSSQTAFSYRLHAEKDGVIVFRGQFLFATVDYNEEFGRNDIERHYQKVFSCLTQNLQKD